MNILIIGATHGNELLGVKLYQRLLRKRSPLLEHVDFLLGNPKAYAARKRYIEKDLNRSYASTDDSCEAQRAQYIRRYIENTSPDLVIDMHTTTCEQPSCIIVDSLAGEMKQRFLRACHVETILQVTSLNDILTLGDFVVGYEVPVRNVTPDLLNEIASDLERCVAHSAEFKQKKLYKMQEKIYKREVTQEQAAEFTNFEMCPLGFVPVMTGENSYKRQTDYLGFKTTAPERIEV